MGDKTGISWTDATWNPVRGCSRVSEGCRNCYAETMAGRFCGPSQPYEGLAKRTPNGARWTGSVMMVLGHLLDPIRWQRPRRIFVNSMSDLFHDELTNEQIAAVFGVMAAAPRHTFQVLTKRAKRMREWFAWVSRMTGGDVGAFLVAHTVTTIAGEAEGAITDAYASILGEDGAATHVAWPLPNVWLGVSVEDQAAADERIPHLLETPAAVRFLSCEPLIGPVDLTRPLVGATAAHILRAHGAVGPVPAHLRPPPSLDWVIAGCESGPGARVCEVSWLRGLRNQCSVAQMPFFLKQACAASEGGDRVYPSKHAAKIEESLVINAGEFSKMKPGGVIEAPYLDGKQWQQFPPTVATEINIVRKR